MKMRTILSGAAAVLLLSAGLHAQAPYKLLSFYGVGGYTHSSRSKANAYLEELAAQGDFQLVKSDQASVFTPANLAQYRVVVLNNCTVMGDLMNPDQRAALLEFMKTKGVVAFHGSADNKGSWPEYTSYIGGDLSSHGVGTATIKIDPVFANASSPILAGLPAETSIHEEWYSYKTNPRLTPGVQVLYDLDETTCPACTKMGDHPAAWIRVAPTGGRYFYTAMGHVETLFTTNAFNRTMLKQAIKWASEYGTTSTRQIPPAPASRASLKGMDGALSVSTDEQGAFTVRLLSLNGRLVAGKSGHGRQTFTFSNLKRATVYTLITQGVQGSRARLVTIP